MSLATRCTACGTIFRIVEDQLRVSDGWVRCGRCAEVFDARELLFDIERDSPPAWPPAFTPSGPEASAPELPRPSPTPPTPAPPEPAPAPVPAPSFESTVAMPLGPEYDETVAMPLEALREESRREPRWMDALAQPATPPAPETEPEPIAAMSDAEPAPEPEFLRRARANERWNRPGVKWALGGLALMLLITLGLQIGLHFRDAIAALNPAMRTPLAALCELNGCKLSAWKRADLLAIESTSLTPIGSRNAYKLQLSLRNKAAVPLATPWLDVSLTDASGTVLARRVLAASALTPSLDELGPESEQSFAFSFTTGSQRVSGYTVDIFHP